MLLWLKYRSVWVNTGATKDRIGYIGVQIMLSLDNKCTGQCCYA